MKKILVVLIVGFIFFGCSAQNVDAQLSNDAQRIVGTWKGIWGGGQSLVHLQMIHIILLQ